MNRAVIISAGSINDYEYVKKFIKSGDFVICADGGYTHCIAMGIKPDITVGDFDSYMGEVRGKIKKLNPEKDYTDTHVAVMTALGEGYREILLLGCSGSRMDHTLSNIGLLEYILNNNGRGILVNENNIIEVIEKKTLVKRREGYHLSFIAIGSVKGVTLENLKYPLNDYDLTFAESVAVSNEFTDKDAAVTIKEGRLIMIMSKD